MITVRITDLFAAPNRKTGAMIVEAKGSAAEGDIAVPVTITTGHVELVAMLRDAHENDRALQLTLANTRGA